MQAGGTILSRERESLNKMKASAHGVTSNLVAMISSDLCTTEEYVLKKAAALQTGDLDHELNPDEMKLVQVDDTCLQF